MSAASLLNLTGHTVVVASDTGEVRIPPTGPAARVSETVGPTTAVVTERGPVPVVSVTQGVVTGLPSERDDVLVIVSRAVATCSADRRDLLVPHGHQRDDEGRVVGCRSLARVGE